MRITHADRSAIPRVSRTPEGYLRGEAIATRIGVFKYTNADGTVRAELRHPDQVLAADSLASLRMIPVTVEHPHQLVDSNTAKDVAVGQTGENVRVDGRHIVVPLTVTHKDGIEAINQGKQELSLGYTLELVQEDGVYEGEKYTHRQTDIVYNHLAIVSQARAGRAARLNLDGVSVQPVNEEPKMKKVNIDGIEYDAAPEVANALTKAQTKNGELQTALDKTQANLDQANEKAAGLQKQLDEAPKLADLVEKRLALVTKAARIDGTKAEALLKLDSDRAIMEAALKAAVPSIVLDGKSDDYVSARFDAVLEGLGEAGSTKASPLNALAPHRGDVANLDAERQAEESWKKSVASLNDWRKQA